MDSLSEVHAQSTEEPVYFQLSQTKNQPFMQQSLVTVEDGDDAGVVGLPAWPPRVGDPLTEVLEEEDGVLPGTTAWTWKSAESVQGPWTDVSGAP